MHGICQLRHDVAGLDAAINPGDTGSRIRSVQQEFKTRRWRVYWWDCRSQLQETRVAAAVILLADAPVHGTGSKEQGAINNEGAGFMAGAGWTVIPLLNLVILLTLLWL